MRAAGDGADTSPVVADGGAVAWDVAGLGLESDQGALRASVLPRGQSFAPDELALAKLHRPAEAGLVGIHGFVHVVAVQTERGFEARGITRAEARRENPRALAFAEDRVPDLRHMAGVDEELKPVLTRIAGARDQAFNPGHLARANSEGRDVVRLRGAARQARVRGGSA